MEQSLWVTLKLTQSEIEVFSSNYSSGDSVIRDYDFKVNEDVHVRFINKKGKNY